MKKLVKFLENVSFWWYSLGWIVYLTSLGPYLISSTNDIAVIVGVLLLVGLIYGSGLRFLNLNRSSVEHE